MPTVLIVDDEQQLLDILQLMLQRAGYKTLTATNGNEGLDLVYQHQPDLLVLDDMLPGISGSDVCMTVKHHAIYKHTPVIMYSAGPRIRDREFIRQIGADAAISKPFKMKEILNLVEHHLRMAVAV